jgi:hnRNP-L/PTB/hephaestus splicing factor
MDDRPLAPQAVFASPIVCFHINKATVPVDVDTILRVCESAFPSAKPLRIVIFYKNGVQALVEMNAPHTAYALAQAVHNQFIYEDCCKIVAAPSRTATALSVQAQNDLTRDLTRPDLPVGPPPNPRTLSPAQMAEREKAIESGQQPPPMPWEAPPAGAMHHHHHHGHGQGPPPPHMGGGYAGGPPPPTHGHMGGGYGGGGGGPGHGPGPGGFGGGAMAHRPARNMAGGSANAAYVPGAGGRGSIIRVVGLDPDRATARRVFNLVCSYGNVRRIKCFPPGSQADDGGASSALVEMEDATQATGATGFLNGHTLFGRRVTLTVVTDTDRIEGAPLGADVADPIKEEHTRDWVGSPHNRFRRAEQFRNVFAPSSTLHVANVPPAYTEQHLEGFITAQGGARPTRVAWMLPGGGRQAVGAPRRVGLVQFASIDEALESMMMANNIFQDGHTIKLAATNKTPR